MKYEVFYSIIIIIYISYVTRHNYDIYSKEIFYRGKFFMIANLSVLVDKHG